MRPLGIVLPTVDSKLALDFILSDESLNNMSSLSSVAKFLINFQGDWNDDLIADVEHRLMSRGFQVDYIKSFYPIEGKGLVPINKIREDTAGIDRNCLFYALVDDDMKFLGKSPKMNHDGGRQYLNILHYMLSNPMCGLTMVGGSMFKKIPFYSVGPVDLVNTYLVSKGFIVRSMKDKGLIVPKGAYELVGSDEEKLAAAFRLSEGLYPAKTGLGRVYHYEGHSSGKTQSGSSMYGWNNSEIVDANNNKFIHENYNPKYRGGNDYRVFDRETYDRNGGIDVYDQSVVDDFTINYMSKTDEQVLDEIRSMCDKLS